MHNAKVIQGPAHLWSRRDRWTVRWQESSWIFYATEVEIVQFVEHVEDYLNRMYGPTDRPREFKVTRDPSL